MLKLSDNTEINQVSLTGVRALVLLALLIEAPRTFKEINQAFIDLNLMRPGDSTDIIRIDINTLRNSGCEITRAGAKTNYKFTLIKHPFSMEFTQEEIAVLKRVYKKIKNNSGIELLLKFDELFKKLAANVVDSETKELLYGLSVFKNTDNNLIKELLEDCREKRKLTLMYQKPSVKTASEKNVLAQRIVIKNDNIYLYCFDFDKNESSTLNIKRILSVISRISGSGNIDIKTQGTLKDAQIFGNQARRGGGVMVWSASFTMDGGVIGGSSEAEGNIAWGSSSDFGGGAVYVRDNSTFLLKRGTISQNKTTRGVTHGGGIRVISGTFRYISCTFSGNTANGRGPDVFINAGVFYATTENGTPQALTANIESVDDL